MTKRKLSLDLLDEDSALQAIETVGNLADFWAAAKAR